MSLGTLFKHLSIRTQMVLLVFVATLPAAVGMAWLIVAESERAREEAYASVRAIGQTLAGNIERELGDYEERFSRIAMRPMVRALDPRRCDPILRDYASLRPELLLLVLRDRQGNVVCVANEGQPPAREQILQQKWFQEGLRSDKFFVSDVFTGPVSGRQVVVLTYPVRNDAGEVGGLLILSLDLLKFQQLVLAGLPKSPFLVALDREYKFLLRSVDPENFIGKPLPDAQLKAIRDRQGDFFTARNIKGISHLWAHVPIPKFDWHVAIGMSEDEVFASQRDVLARSIVLAVLVLIMVALLAWWAVRPILELARVSARIASGDTSVRARISGSTEVEAVAEQFNRMLVERERTLQTLAQSEERFVRATRGSSDGFWDWNIVTGENYFSERFCELLGYRPDELKPHLDTWLELLHPDEKECILRVVQGHLEQREPYDVEIRMRTKSGEYRWFRTRGQAVRNEAGQPVRMAGSIIDITERKQSEDALRESEERFFKAFSSNPTAMAIRRKRDDVIIDVNLSFERLVGYGRADLVGKKVQALNFYVDSEDPKKVLQTLDEKEMLSNMEVSLRKGDGNTAYVLLSTEEITLKGEACLLGDFVDITERKAAEEKVRVSLREKEVLLKEIYHRVKNNLQVISSLLNLQSTGAGAEARALLQESASRVKSMALVHEQLYQSEDLSSIDFRNYVKRLLENLMIANGEVAKRVKVRCDVDDVHLGIETAIPLGLMINELISNCYKHAYPGERGGEVVLRLRVLDGGALALEVADDGVGLSPGFDPAKLGSLGMQLVVSLSEQLGSKLEYGRNGQQGARFAMHFAPEGQEAQRLETVA